MDLRAAPLIAFASSIDVHDVHNSSFDVMLAPRFDMRGRALTKLACEPRHLPFQEQP
jgi:hypothetical protein